MQKNITTISATEQSLEIILSTEEFAKEYDQEMEEAKRTVQIKGFRKGHVPLGMLKKLVGPAIEASVAEKMASKHFTAIVDEEKIKPASRAAIDSFNFENDKLTIKLLYQIHPAFELKNFADYSFTKRRYTVAEEDVQREINLILKGHGTLLSVNEAARATDTVIGDVVKLNEENKAEQETALENHHFNLEYLPEENAFHKALVGKKAGDVTEIVTEPKETQTTAQNYRVSVKEIKRLELPELTDELVKEITGDRFENTEEFKADVRRQLEEHFSAKSESELLESISDKLIEENPVPAPKAMVTSFTNMLLEKTKQQMGGHFPKGFDVKQFAEAMAPNAEKHARWLLISQKIAETNNLTVTEKDIKSYAEKEAEKDSSIKPEELLSTYMSTEFRNYITDTILKNKVYDIIKAQVTITEEPAPIPTHET